MKHLVLSFILVSCLVSACNNNKKTVETKNDEEKTTAGTDKMQEASDQVQKKTEELQDLSPLSTDELKALLPEELITAKKATEQANSVNGTGLASAQYILNDSAELRVSITDCGGPGGAGYYSRQAPNLLNDQSAGDNETTKTIDFKGEKALQHCNSNENLCTFTYFGGDRFWVIMEGHNIPPDELKRAAGELKLK